MTSFKKFGVAAAVAAALGASSAAQALTLGEPGDALLIPHVYASSDATTNTLIGVIVAPNSGVFQDQTPAGALQPFPTLTAQPNPDPNNAAANGLDACSYLSGPGGTGNVLTLPRLHWYFFDVRSNKVADDSVPVSCHDFVRIDWAYLAAQKGQLGVRGYMVITDQRNYVSNGIPTTNTMIMYGASFMIQGNWQSQAFIPVLPIRNDPDTAGTVQAAAPDELFFGGQNFPAEVNPVAAGMALPADGGAVQTATFSLRYFQDPALSGGTAFVIWFPDNGAARTVDSNGVFTYSCPSGTTPGKPGGRCRLGLTLDYYDADENQASTAYSLPNELNIINPVTDLHISPTHVAANPIPDLGDPANGAAIGTGFAIFSLSDGVPTASLPGGYGPRFRGGVAFSLIDINGANGAQVQTELAHERGIRAPGG